MKRQILLATLCLIAILVSVSAVSAANLTVGTGGTYSNIQDAYDDANDGDTIIIANGLYTGDDNTGIGIYKNLNITGQSQNGTIIDANHQDFIFYIGSGYTVTLSKLTMRDGDSDEGGAFENNGNLTVMDCTFDSNTADSDGGAIHNEDELTLIRCTFTNNTGEDGGAIYGCCGFMVIKDCVFINNAAYDCCGGGAIYTETPMNITGCTFTNNYADYDGGAIYNEGPSIITNSTFTGNEAYDCCGGGAIYNDDELTLTDCTFTNNKATDSDGGALYVCCGNVILTRCIFTNNTADENGGAIYFSDETLNITGCNFNKNTAGDYGGAIYIEGNGEGNYAVNAKYSRFVGNMVGTTAQDIYMNGFGTTVDFRYNWWGSNDGPAAGRIAQIEGTPSNESYMPWLVMNTNTDPSTIYAGATSKITANVYTDSEGTDHSGNATQFFSGPEVTFTTNLGNVGSKSVTVDWILGMATAILRGDEGPGIASLTATDGAQTGNATVTILQSPEVNAVGMQDTGFPMAGLILAILAVFGGLAGARKTN